MKYIVEIDYKKFIFDRPADAMFFAMTATDHCYEDDKYRVSVDIIEDKED